MERSYPPTGINTRETTDHSLTANTRFTGRRFIDRVLAGEHQAVPYSVRLFFYILITSGSIYGLMFLLQQQSARVIYAENGILEWVQITVLLICAIILSLSARYLSDLRQAVHLLSIMPLIAAVRELDHILDHYVYDGAWQTIVLTLLLYLAYYTWKYRQNIKSNMRRILAVPPAGLLLAGFIAVMVFSRIFGQQMFWQIALQDNYIKLVARIAEESCEIFGYLLLLFGCIELLIFALSCNKDQRHTFQTRHNKSAA